jgi:hypothetical protein
MKFLKLFLLFFMTHMIIAGMTTEVANLVFLASFLGISLAVLTGDILCAVNGN